MLLKGLTDEEELSFRRPIQIHELAVYDNGEAYPICPKCRIPFDGQYQKYCSYCGQCLKWTNFSRAKPIQRRTCSIKEM